MADEHDLGNVVTTTGLCAYEAETSKLCSAKFVVVPTLMNLFAHINNGSSRRECWEEVGRSLQEKLSSVGTLGISEACYVELEMGQLSNVWGCQKWHLDKSALLIEGSEYETA